jgi:Tat protein secretion system quality control protein TatD with DNase activity
MKESTVQAIPTQKLLIESDEPSRCSAALQFRQDASFDNRKKELSPFSLVSFAREQVNALSTVAHYICISHKIDEAKLWPIIESNFKDFLQKD